MPGPSEEQAYLCLGGNLGNPRETMAAALRRIDADRLTKVVAVSALFRTPPWGVLDQPPFLNAVAEVRTTRSPRALLDLCLDTEIRLKRVRGERFGPRLIDIDVLLYGDRSVRKWGSKFRTRAWSCGRSCWCRSPTSRRNCPSATCGSPAT